MNLALFFWTVSELSFTIKTSLFEERDIFFFEGFEGTAWLYGNSSSITLIVDSINGTTHWNANHNGTIVYNWPFTVNGQSMTQISGQIRNPDLKYQNFTLFDCDLELPSVYKCKEYDILQLSTTYGLCISVVLIVYLMLSVAFPEMKVSLVDILKNIKDFRRLEVNYLATATDVPSDVSVGIDSPGSRLEKLDYTLEHD